MNETVLTSEAKEAIRSYMIRLVTLPGFLATIIAFGLGYFVKDVATQRAYNTAYDKATQTIQTLTVKAAEAASEAKRGKDDLTRLVADVEGALEEADTLRKELGTVKALIEEGEDFVVDVSTNIMERSDFWSNLTVDLGSGKAKEFDTTYSAESAGFVTATAALAGAGRCIIYGYAAANCEGLACPRRPEFLRATSALQYAPGGRVHNRATEDVHPYLPLGSITFPVRKDEFWIVTGCAGHNVKIEFYAIELSGL